MVSTHFLSLWSPRYIVTSSSCSVLVSLYLYCFILYAHIEILAVIVINNPMFDLKPVIKFVSAYLNCKYHYRLKND